jgi:hypothetical protein
MMTSTIREVSDAVANALNTLPITELRALQSVIQARIDSLKERDTENPRSAFLEDDASRRRIADDAQGRREYRVDDHDRMSPRSWFLRQTADMHDPERRAANLARGGDR